MYKTDKHEYTHGTRIGVIKWSFVRLMTTAIFQAFIVYFSSSVALLVDPVNASGERDHGHR